ncbi:penicillin-binding transpeptidase domain-containing protein, partial [Roseofilum sp. Belize Diploria]|uniref:penicillin-binding transpeptidase domain-containing protein n=1 Tax=Roseofilum sp. Belize Diploria TaxID=2821501 RepID=UPI001B2108C4|nr:hypothetical protein [Roseofilum sp. Belize Diploria]
MNFEQHFRNLNANGSIVIYDSNNDRTYQYNSTRNKTAFNPASTFKILSSLIVLESNVIPSSVQDKSGKGRQEEGLREITTTSNNPHGTDEPT